MNKAKHFPFKLLSKGVKGGITKVNYYIEHGLYIYIYLFSFNTQGGFT